MRILVTGSEGSLMQAVIPKLIAQGHTIVGVDNLYRHGVESVHADTAYPFVKCDLTDRTATFQLFDQPFDAVFLAAAKIYGVGGFNHYCGDIISDDIAIQSNVFAACAKFKVPHVVYISSSMVYETCVQDLAHPVTEDLVNDCVVPKTDYGLSKLVGERMCHAFNKQYGINYTIWRPFNIITPHESAMATQGFSHVFADFIKKLRNNENPLPILGTGEQVRCFTWIDDVATVIANFSFHQRATNQAFNICNVEPVTMKDLAQRIYAALGNNDTLSFETVNNYKNDVIVRVPSIDKLTATFGPYPFKPLDYCIERCIAV